MFKKFEAKESIVGTNQMKNSVQRSIRNKLIASYPNIEEFINDIIPKKMNLKIVKCQVISRISTLHVTHITLHVTHIT